MIRAKTARQHPDLAVSVSNARLRQRPHAHSQLGQRVPDALVPMGRTRPEHHYARLPLAHSVRAAQVSNHGAAP